MADSETPKKYQVGPWMTVDDVVEVVDAGVRAQREGKLKAPEASPEEDSTKTRQADPHGIVDVFDSRYTANLELMHPDAAAREAMSAVDSFLKSSTFIDLGSKSTKGRHYMRVDRKPEEMRR